MATFKAEILPLLRLQETTHPGKEEANTVVFLVRDCPCGVACGPSEDAGVARAVRQPDRRSAGGGQWRRLCASLWGTGLRPVHRLPPPPTPCLLSGPACCTVSEEVTSHTGGLQRSLQLQFVKGVPPVLFVQTGLTSRSWFVCERRQLSCPLGLWHARV